MSRRTLSPMLVLPIGMLAALAGAYRSPHHPATTLPADAPVAPARPAPTIATRPAPPAAPQPPSLASLLADPAWTPAADLPTARAAVEAALWAGPDSRADLADTLGRLAMARDPRAPALLACLRDALRLDSDSPVLVALSREPGRWLDAIDADAPLAQRMSELSTYFDWPDRPPPEGRKSNLRPLSDAEQRRFDAGERLYAASCAGCHQPTGQGALGIGPSLVASPLVAGPALRLGLILIDGLEGPYRMAGLDFQGVMVPAPSQADADLAAILTYIRRAWGNSADPVAPDAVAAIKRRSRGKPWTRPELDSVRE
ncbi:MAG: c-type cytochrome [Phycisphaerae bacterium]|nr:c-type cytochrome [Phycisphaerae bacterium]